MSTESLALLTAANKILVDLGICMTVRQIYYQLVAADMIPNSVSSYRKVVRVLKDGRLTGLIDWDFIEDRLREPKVPSKWESVDEIVNKAVEAFRLDRWEGQDYYVEVWLEKDALAGIVGEIAAKWQVTLQVNRGYSSVTALREASIRLEVERYKGKEAIVGYLGDHDPSGEDMVRDIRDRLSTFGAEVEVTKIAILQEDIDTYHLPPQPVKLSDSRAEGFRLAHGDDCVELDALRPDVLEECVERYILNHLYLDDFEAVKAEEDRQRSSVKVERKEKS